MDTSRARSRLLVLVDGEHHPPVVRAAVAELERAGDRVVGAVLLGGAEKLGGAGRSPEAPWSAGGPPDYGVGELITTREPRVEAQIEALREGLARCRPDAVVDVSDDPVVDPRSRLRLAAHALAAGASFRGSDFAFEPPPRPRLAGKPSVAVVGCAKRSGKTALTGYLARLLLERGTTPVVVTMGRGGPEDPEVVDVTSDLSPRALLALAACGRHAASDHLEGALMARVPTIGTRRAGGGLAGAPVTSTFARGLELADLREEPVLVFDGSGRAVPPAHADATVCAVPAHADPELVTDYLGSYVLLLADLVVVTLAEQPLVPAARALEDRIRELVPGTPIVRTTFRPRPLESVSGRSVFFATTAPPEVADRLAGHLEDEHGARVVGRSSNLANRTLLTGDLRAATSAETTAEVLVTELKAAAVDVATEAALEAEMDVVFCDNRPVTTGGDGPLDHWLGVVADAAVDRFPG